MCYLTGRDLYERYATIKNAQNVQVETYDELDTEEQNAWDILASDLERTYK